MMELKDGETTEMKGSGAKPYVLKRQGPVYSCTCPAWRNQSLALERRTCKHLKKYLGAAEEDIRTTGTSSVIQSNEEKPDVSAKVSPAPVLLAESWNGETDVTGWIMSEKLDGVRAYWDGTNFISRLGNRYYAPDWFRAKLPTIPLDGELWLNRKSFQRTISIVRRQDESDDWKQIRFIVFDCPVINRPFLERITFLQELITGVEYATAIDFTTCEGADHLRQELKRIEALGGEGVMLRAPDSYYEVGRSRTLLKVKSFFDAEAVVIEHVGGKGKHKGRLGKLMVKRPDGIEFGVGTGFTDKERENPPPIGSTITYRYQELTDGGVPRFPSFIRLREDV